MEMEKLGPGRLLARLNQATPEAGPTPGPLTALVRGVRRGELPGGWLPGCWHHRPEGHTVTNGSVAAPCPWPAHPGGPLASRGP